MPIPNLLQKCHRKASFQKPGANANACGVFDRVFEGEMLTDGLFNDRILYQKRGDASKVWTCRARAHADAFAHAARNMYMLTWHMLTWSMLTTW